MTVLFGNAALDGVVTALAAKSKSGISYAVESGPLGPTQEPGSGVYSTIADKVTLLFQTASGVTIQVTLPAPDASIFLADGKTVDPAQIADIITACVGTVQTLDGNVAIGFLNGFRGPTSGKEYAR